MADILSLIGGLFKQIFNWMDGFYLFGSYSLLDFIISCIVVDIIITALFVTFNVHAGTRTYVDEEGYEHKHHIFSITGGQHGK